MKNRIITGIVMAIGFLGLLRWGGIPFALLIMAMALIGLYEFIRMHGYRVYDAAGWIGSAAMIGLTFPWYALDGVRVPPMESLTWVFIFLLFSVTVLSANRINVRQVSIITIGVLYIGIGFRCMTFFRLEYGILWSFFLFVCTWISDIGAYFVGMAFGRRPLWPAISPKKTVEGSLGGIACTVLFAVLYSFLFPDFMHWPQAALLGLIISLLGQWGDLIQSAYKRVNQVKDSGTIFPGHGGVLDRCDSWLIVFPAVHLILSWI